MTSRLTISAFIILSIGLLTQGCASSLQGDVYGREDARKTMSVRQGKVLETHAVVIEGDRNVFGGGAGAIIGGVAGSAVGSGAGRSVATAVGAVAGAVAGQAAQEKVTRAQGLQMILQLDNGETLAVVQAVSSVDEFRVGDRIRLIYGNGTTRVSHDNK